MSKKQKLNKIQAKPIEPTMTACLRVSDSDFDSQIQEANIVDIGLTELVDANDKLKDQLETMQAELTAANEETKNVKEKAVEDMKRIRAGNEERIETLRKEYFEQLKQQQQEINELKGKNTMTPEQIEQLNQKFKQQQDQITELKNKGNAMTPEQVNKFMTILDDLTTHVKASNTTSQETTQEIESLKQQLEQATSRSAGIQQELDNVTKEKAELTKWNSKHNLKVAGAVVGAIVIIAGVAYVVRRLLANGEAEVEAVEAPELSVVNY